MKRILLLGRPQAGEKNDLEALAGGLQKHAGEAEIMHGYFEDLLFVIGSESSVVSLESKNMSYNLADFDMIIFLHWTADRVHSDIAHAAAMYAAAHDTVIWNSELLKARSMTKLSQLLAMQMAGLHIPRSVFSMKCSHISAAVSNMTPFVYKDITASRGRNNVVVSSEEELDGYAKQFDGKPMLAQAFIPNDKSDLRFFISGGKVMLAILRHGTEDSHLNNISAGGSAELVGLDTFEPSLIAEVESVAKLFGRELCGIDYIFDQSAKKYVFLEINGTPQIINGVFADEKLRAMIGSLNLNQGNE